PRQFPFAHRLQRIGNSRHSAMFPVLNFPSSQKKPSLEPLEAWPCDLSGILREANAAFSCRPFSLASSPLSWRLSSLLFSPQAFSWPLFSPVWPQFWLCSPEPLHAPPAVPNPEARTSRHLSPSVSLASALPRPLRPLHQVPLLPCRSTQLPRPPAL